MNLSLRTITLASVGMLMAATMASAVFSVHSLGGQRELVATVGGEARLVGTDYLQLVQ